MVGSNHSSGPSRPHVILFVDNVPAFLETRAEYLEDAGYQVVPAYTLEEARRLLEQQTIDLAILDVRMVDDEDPKDISGILLARDPHYASVPKIILTDYPDYRTARQALGPVLDGMPPAVDYLDKKEGPEVMVERVGQVLAQFNPLNQHLMIRWASEWSFPALVTLLEPHVGTALEGRASELERLFRRLFLREPGHLYLEVTRLDQDGNVHVEVLRCGRRSLGEQETDRYGCFAPAEAVLGTTLLDEDRVSIHYSVARYRLVGSFGPPIRPLGEVINCTRPRWGIGINGDAGRAPSLPSATFWEMVCGWMSSEDGFGSFAWRWSVSAWPASPRSQANGPSAILPASATGCPTRWPPGKEAWSPAWRTCPRDTSTVLSPWIVFWWIGMGRAGLSTFGPPVRIFSSRTT